MNKEIEFKSIIQSINNGGWNLFTDNKVTYLPIGDGDMFDWISEEISFDQFFTIVKIKEQNKELVAVELIWKDTEIGCQLLIYDSNNFSFQLSINTKYLDKAKKIPDYNWYAERILCCLLEEYHISEHQFEFVY